MGSIKIIIINILITTSLIAAIDGQFNSHCPSPDLLEPCHCRQTSSLSPVVIYCGGNTSLDLKAVFTRLSTNLTEKERDFPVLYVNNTAITELSENTFGDIGFGTIFIRGAHSLKKLNMDTFKGRTSSVTKILKIFYTPVFENCNGSLFKAISKLDKLSSLSLYNTNLTELPDNAFQNGNPLLQEVRLSGKSIVRLGENAFKKSHNFMVLYIVNTSISYIPNEALVVENPTTNFMINYIIGNNLINGDSFAPRSLININRTTILFLSSPMARAENITFLDKNSFLPFLEADLQNSIVINDRSFNCSDSRNQWLIESKYLSKVKFTDCKSKTNQTEEYNTEWKQFKTEFGKTSSKYSLEFSMNGSVPDHIDWRDKNIVTSIKDQIVEKCGSCWAQAAVATIEGQMALKYGRLVSLSAQNLVDCSTKYGNMGCEGGLTDLGYDYIIENGGIPTEESYPYKAKDQECQLSNKTIGARITGYIDLPQRDEQMLKRVVALIGPIAVRVEATGYDFYNYKSGVYIDELCSEEIQDSTHMMTAVGYGTTPEGQDYWLLKNSMGTEWGEKGFVKWARNRNMCGVANSPSYPIGVQ